MSALNTYASILDSKLAIEDFRYCLVDENKRPFKIDNTPAKPNTVEDFIKLIDLFQCEDLESYAGIGISVQASKVFAIDVDHCFSEPFDKSTISDLAKSILELFSNTYAEFSFSGKGMRILFKSNILNDYSDTYYIKNSKLGVEFYQPSNSYRYVTVTGRSLNDNNVEFIENVFEFLNAYMKKPERKKTEVEDELEFRSFDVLLKLTKKAYFKDFHFQDLWFTKAPGSGKDESERDYHLVAYLYENITKDKEMIKKLFESSEFFKTKDSKHIYKWTNLNGRYFDYLYSNVRRTH